MDSATCLPTALAFSASLLLAAGAFADSSAPGGPTAPEPPRQPMQPAAELPLLAPSGGPVGSAGSIQLPPSFPQARDTDAAKDAAVDAVLGVGIPIPLPGVGGPQTLGAGQVHAAILEDGGCSWTNDNVASCMILECDADGVCVEAGTYCVDHYGNQVPCP